ncbi:unnamed protein product, partial [Ixodes pacificus]
GKPASESRGRGLLPTPRDAGFAKTAETAVSTASKGFHDDRWRRPPLPIQKKKTPRLRASSHSNYAKIVGTEAIGFSWCKMYSLVKNLSALLPNLAERNARVDREMDD